MNGARTGNWTQYIDNIDQRLIRFILVRKKIGLHAFGSPAVKKRRAYGAVGTLTGISRRLGVVLDFV